MHHSGVLSSFGDGDDVSVIEAIERAARRNVPIDIVVMSFGAYAADDDAAPPMAYTIRRVLSRRPRHRLRRQQRVDVEAVLPRRAPGGRRRRRPRRAGAGVVLQLRRLGRRLRPGASTWSARSSCDSTTASMPIEPASSTSSAAGRRGAAPASPRRRSPVSWPRRCTSNGGTASEAWRRLRRARQKFRCPTSARLQRLILVGPQQWLPGNHFRGRGRLSVREHAVMIGR